MSYILGHRLKLANNIGGGGGRGGAAKYRQWVLGTLIYEGVKLERGEGFF